MELVDAHGTPFLVDEVVVVAVNGSVALGKIGRCHKQDNAQDSKDFCKIFHEKLIWLLKKWVAPAPPTRFTDDFIMQK
jgi:hypothetical protein